MKKSIFLVGLIMAVTFNSCDKSSLDKNFGNETIATTTTTEVETTVCETAFAIKTTFTYPEENYVACFSELGFNRWGWTNGLVGLDHDRTYYYIYAGAGQCDVSKGTFVGQLVIYNNHDGTLTAFVDLEPGFGLSEDHLYIGSAPLPLDNNGNPTVAPGQYPYIHENLNGANTDTFTVEGITSSFYVIFHAVVCGL